MSDPPRWTPESGWSWWLTLRLWAARWPWVVGSVGVGILAGAAWQSWPATAPAHATSTTAVIVADASLPLSAVVARLESHALAQEIGLREGESLRLGSTGEQLAARLLVITTTTPTRARAPALATATLNALETWLLARRARAATLATDQLQDALQRAAGSEIPAALHTLQELALPPLLIVDPPGPGVWHGPPPWRWGSVLLGALVALLGALAGVLVVAWGQAELEQERREQERHHVATTGFAGQISPPVPWTSAPLIPAAPSRPGSPASGPPAPPVPEPATLWFP